MKRFGFMEFSADSNTRWEFLQRQRKSGAAGFRLPLWVSPAFQRNLWRHEGRFADVLCGCAYRCRTRDFGEGEFPVLMGNLYRVAFVNVT